MRAMPASSSTRLARQSIRGVSLSRAAEGCNDFAAERLRPPAPHALDRGQLLDRARRRLRDLTDDPVRQQHTGLESDALGPPRAPLAPRTPPPPSRAARARSAPG